MFARKGFWLAAAVGVFWIAQVAPGQETEAPMPAVLQNYQPVTAERLKNPEDGDWLMIRRTYDGWGYSPLDGDHARQRRAAAARCG